MKTIFKLEIDPSRVFGLDLLRAVAILCVVLGHAGQLIPASLKLRQMNDLFVFDGVSLFFVLSGFLIGGILIRMSNEDGVTKRTLYNFWMRRWFRTFPNYFLILLLLCLLNLFFNDGFLLRSCFSYFLFSQNLCTMHPPFFPEAWSLSVEEWFYVLVPVFIAVSIAIFRTTAQQGILITSAVLIFAVPLFRYYRYVNFTAGDLYNWDLVIRKQVITRLDSLMYGVVGAYLSYYHSGMWLKYKKPLVLFGLLLLLLSKFLIPKYAPISSMYSTVFSFSVGSFAALLMLPYLSELKRNKGMFYTGITYLSLISYSMYLLNLSIIRDWIIIQLPWHELTTNATILAIAKYGLFWILLIPLSILLYSYFEVPMTRFREKVNFKLRS